MTKKIGGGYEEVDTDEKIDGIEGEDSEIEENEEDTTDSKSEIEDAENGRDEQEKTFKDEELENSLLQDSDLLVTTSGDVSRIEWITELVNMFEMTVAKDNYPDNYYSDIDSGSEDYHVVMLATEFGLIDVEAGEAFRPNEPAVREFAAHTLNYCLGFMAVEEDGYTYSEASQVSYPDDIQVAVNRGWFKLAEGKFMPDAAITLSEKETMLKDARMVLADTRTDYNNSYQFANDVIILPENTEAELTDDNELTVYNLEASLRKGDRFALITDGFPTVFRVTNLTESDAKTVIEFENVAMEEAFKSINIAGTINGELASAQAYDSSIEISYIVGGTPEEEWEDGTKYDSLAEVGSRQISALEARASYDIPESVKKEFDLGDGTKATVTCKVSNVKVDYNASIADRCAYVDVDATVIFGCNVSLDVLEASGVSPTIDLIKIPIAYIGFFSVQFNLSMNGEVTLSLVENISVGVHYDGNNGFRMTKNFSKESFTIQAYAEFDASIVYSVGVNVCNCLTGSIYGKFGAKSALDFKEWNDGERPLKCTHIRTWFYASTGCSVAVDLILHKDRWQKSNVIYSENNSPVRVSFHYEDGVAVPVCTREKVKGSIWKYYTSADSRYGYNGASSGVGANGEPYTIFEYSLDSSNRATITGYKGNVSALSIPKTLDGYTVVGIGNHVFQNNKMLRVVVIPDSVTEIGFAAFGDCTNLSQVTLSKRLEEIYTRAFSGCDSLTTIEIPKSLKAVSGLGAAPYGVFFDCTNLKKIVFEEGVTKIPRYLFSNCPGIEEIEIPNTVTVIEEYAINNCRNLRKVNIPDSVTMIGNGAFENNIKLTEINIPNSVRTIGAWAFSDCTNLSQVTLSKRLEEIYTRAFSGCDSLTTIEIPKSLKTVSGLGAAPYGVFFDCTNLKKIVFEEGVTKIPRYLFSNCPGIEEIEIPDTVIEIGNSAFENCGNLRKVNIPNSVTTINDYAFQNCRKLTEANISDGVTEIGNSVFSDCTSLSQIVLPDSITDMGTYIFSGCSSLKKATLPNRRINITEGTFKNCSSLEKVNFPETVEAVRAYAFYNTKLSEVVLPEKVTTIENYAFYNCDSLTKVIIPDSTTTLGSYVFSNCELLADVTLGMGISAIPSYAFHECPSLQKLVLPYRTKTINNNAFTNCTSLTEITIPQATETIADGIFSYPSRLTIYGISGTYAETYANNIGAAFVNQEKKATEVKLNTTDLKVVRGKSATLVLSVVPTDFTDRVTWKSTNADVVTVTDAGVVTARSLGTATVKVTVGDISASCKVSVTQPVTSISLSKTSLSLEAGSTETLTANVSPSTADNKEIEWSTSNDKVASVNEKGLVTAHAKGTAKITATAKDGSGVSRSCNVSVINNGYVCNGTEELESPHNYPVNCSDFWVYTKEGAESLYVAFDARTNVEEDFDFLYIYDGNGKQIGKYTGTSLAGQTIEVPGDTIKIKLSSDDSGTAWGFKVTYVMGTGNVENDEYLVTFDTQGGSAVSSVQVARDTEVGEPAEPKKSGFEFLGWYLGETVYDFAQPVTRNIVLRAKWKRIAEKPTEDEKIPEEDMPEDGKIPEGLWIAGVKNQAYTGKAVKPEVRVYDGSRQLKEKVDYTLSYKNNTKANDASNEKTAPTITVKGKGNYSGTAVATFQIQPVDISDTMDSSVIISDMTLAYTKKEQKKAPVVTFNGKKLSAKRDYIVSYPDEGDGAYRNAGNYQIQIAGKGNFTGVRTIKLEITDKKLIEKVKAVKIPNQIYNDGEEVILPPEVLVLYTKSKSNPLAEGADYTVRYENNREIGTATAVITGTGEYAGVKKLTFKIIGTSIAKAAVIGIENKVYNGKAQYQDIMLKIDDTVLEDGVDYEVSYSKNENIGTARMIIQGIGGYSGTIKKSFKITAYDLSKDEENLITGLQTDAERNPDSGALNEESDEKAELTVKYTKGGCKPEPVLKFGAVELEKGKDYSISYKNNTNIADASAKKAPAITIKGKGNFKGTLSVKFSIVKKNLADNEYPVTVSVADISYAKGAGKYISKPVLTDVDGKVLKLGTDYDVTYMKDDGITKLNKKSVVNAGAYVCVAINGRGKYEGNITTTYRITQANFTKASVKITPQVYTGSAIYLAGEDVSVKIGATELTEGRDYEILEDSYANNVKKGTASVRIRGLGNYGGTKTVKFKIQARKMESFNRIVRAILMGAG